MEQYIKKSALVTKIEKCYNECLKRAKITDSDYWNAKADTYRNVLEILNDTLEVKEVDSNDAFINKATLWLTENASDYCILHNSYDTKELVEDFIAAMKRD